MLRDQSDLLEISSKVCIFTLYSCRLDQVVQIRPKFGIRPGISLILKIRPNSGLILKIGPNACRHLKNLCNLGLRLEFGLRTIL